MADLKFENTVTVSVSATPKGASAFNTANLALFTHEAYGDDFGDDGYKIYLTGSEVATDFGTDSMTAKMGNVVFAQSPNILTPGGYFVVIPLKPAGSKITFSNVPDTGKFSFYYGTDTAHTTGDIAAGADADAVQTAVRTIPALSKATVTGSFTDGFVVSTPGDLEPSFTISANTLNLDGTDTTVTFTAQPVETLAEAIARTSDDIAYVGILASRIIGQTEALAAATLVQADYKMAFLPSNDSASIEVGGQIDLYRSGGFNKTRGLYHGLSEEAALVFSAGYASRGLSTNFSGSNTTITMNLKELAAVPVDTTMTQTLKNKAEKAGADIYPSMEGLSTVLSFGANKYFDQVHNLIWFLTKLQRDAYNYLRMTSTKIPQTEAGADGLDNVCRKVCAQAIINAYGAPGEWTIFDTFGDPETFKQNIREVGYYVYHTPLANQSAAERASRKLPLCQVALKEAGAVHGASILVYINE